MAAPMRVRQILAGLDSHAAAELKKLLPAKFPVPDVATQRYPAALLAAFPKDQSYSFLGLVAEELLRLPHAEITLPNLLTAAQRWMPTIDCSKITKSTTTAPFLEALVATRKALEAVLRPADGPLRFEEEVVAGSVAGHPDARNATQIFEVKLTGMLKQNWTAFLFQTFAYGALVPEAKDVYIVLPLQRMVWSYSLAGWGAKREAFREFLAARSTVAQTSGLVNAMMATALRELYSIGVHAPKQKSLAGTVASLGDYSKPYQIFLGGPQTSKMSVADGDLALAAEAVGRTGARIYVHSQYIINLCAKTDDWHLKLLIQNLQVAAAMGGRGVVVHVGKSTTQPLAEALEQQRKALAEALTHATPECPLLLETPAGQGTETLTKQEEFLDFVASFGDPRLRMCLDTCHVFACGHQPQAYIEAAMARPGGLLKLIHYNDSHGDCGSCVDRHAYIGTGKIGFEKMRAVAEIGAAAGVPMVIE
jgi:deoxyribonuclease-4